VLAAGKAAAAAKRAAANGSDPAAALGKLDGASVGRLFRLLRPEAPRLAGAIATLGVTTGISLVFPWAIGRVLDVALAPAAAFSPGLISAGLLGLFCVQSSLIVLRSTLLTVAGERLSAGIRRDLLKAVLSQDAAWFDRQRTGDVINRLSSDTAALQNALTTQVTGGLRSLFMAGGSAGMLFYLSPPLAALSLVLIPPVAGLGMAYGRYVAGQQRAVQEALGHTMEVAEELVGNIRAVRQYGGERGAAARFDGAVGDSYRLARRIGIVAAWFDGAVHMAANFGLVAVLWYGGNQIGSGALSAGDLTSFLMYSLYTGFNLGNLSKVYSDLKRASGVADRIYEIAGTRPGVPLAAARPIEFWGGGGGEGGGAGSLTRGRPTDIMRVLDAAAGGGGGAPLLVPAAVRGHVAFRGLHFAYPTRPDAPVLAGVDLDVPPGANLALVGASGSGKSTLGLLLTRLYDATGGAVELDGVDVRALDPTWLRAQVAVVPQEPALFATSVAENIRYGRPGASDGEVEAAARLANAHEFISAFPEGYATRVGERGAQLSGGAWGGRLPLAPPRLPATRAHPKTHHARTSHASTRRPAPARRHRARHPQGRARACTGRGHLRAGRRGRGGGAGRAAAAAQGAHHHHHRAPAVHDSQRGCGGGAGGGQGGGAGHVCRAV
jgi:ATP-binding cassette subfamily B protein